MEKKQPIITLKELVKKYENNVVALDHINLDIYKGDIIGIIGMSGAGKSTLVRCLNYLEKVTEGEVYFDGDDLSKLSAKELNAKRQSIAMIFQQFNLLAQRTVLKNITFPMELLKVDKKERNRRAMELLELVGLADKADSYPAQLSGGQKQRVAIARALATNPKVLLCDEATSALDPTTTRDVLNLLKEINQKLGITIVVITHEMFVVEQICNKVAILEHGVLVEKGDVKEVFAKPKTEAAKKLVYPDGEKTEYFEGKRQIRIVFDGKSSFEPVIANMILDCKEQVNIIFANTQNIEGIATGQMVLQIPENPIASAKIIEYLTLRNLSVEEVGQND